MEEEHETHYARIQERDHEDEPLTCASAEMSALLCTQKQRKFQSLTETKTRCHGDVECNRGLELNIAPASKVQPHSTRERASQCLKVGETRCGQIHSFPCFTSLEKRDLQDWVTEIRGQIGPLCPVEYITTIQYASAVNANVDH